MKPKLFWWSQSCHLNCGELSPYLWNSQGISYSHPAGKPAKSSVLELKNTQIKAKNSYELQDKLIKIPLLINTCIWHDCRIQPLPIQKIKKSKKKTICSNATWQAFSKQHSGPREADYDKKLDLYQNYEIWCFYTKSSAKSAYDTYLEYFEVSS